MRKIILFLAGVLFSALLMGQTSIDLDQASAAAGDSSWQSADVDTLYFARDSVYITADGDSIKFVVDDTEGFRIVNVTTDVSTVFDPLGTFGTAANPTVAFGDGNTGFYEIADNNFALSIAGVSEWSFQSTLMGTVRATGPAFRELTPTSTVPSFIPNKGDLDSGVGSAGPDSVSIIAGGVEGLRVVEGSGTSQSLFSLGLEAQPSISFIGDDNLGIYRSAADVMRFSMAGNAEWLISGQFTSDNGAGILDEGPTTTNPVFILNASKETTGIGGDDDTQVSLISGGAEILNAGATGITVTGIVSATGNISGTTDITLDTDPTVTLTTADCRNKARFNNDADVIDYTLPGAAVGLVVIFYDIGGGVITIDPVDGTDTIYLNGTSVGAGDEIDSPGDVGDFIALMAIDATRWVTIGRSGTWVDANP